MPDRYPPSQQRAALKKLGVALDCSSTAFQTDECGDPVIRGSAGHVYAVPGTIQNPGKEGFTLYLECDSPRAWTFAKRALAFAELMNDGDEEGAFALHRLPTATEAETVRRYLGIRQRRHLSDDARAAAIARLRAPIAGVVQAEKVASKAVEVHP